MDCYCKQCYTLEKTRLHEFNYYSKLHYRKYKAKRAIPIQSYIRIYKVTMAIIALNYNID